MNEKDPYRPLPQCSQQKCDAEECHCPNGRDHVADQGEWHLNHCKYCNYVGIHAKCRTDDSNKTFGCQRCKEMILKVTRKSETKTNAEPDADSMYLDRLNMFFSKSNLDVKPQPPPWLI